MTYTVTTTTNVNYGTATGSGGVATCNSLYGQVTTESFTTAAGAFEDYTINNTFVATGDVVLVNIYMAGNPSIVVGRVFPTTNQIILRIHNIHASAAFANPALITFYVFKKLVDQVVSS